MASIFLSCQLRPQCKSRGVKRVTDSLNDGGENLFIKTKNIVVSTCYDMLYAAERVSIENKNQRVPQTIEGKTSSCISRDSIAFIKFQRIKPESNLSFLSSSGFYVANISGLPIIKLLNIYFSMLISFIEAAIGTENLLK